MVERSLKQKATNGVLWTAVQKYSTMGISFISGIILARLLDPSDYGCIGMLSVFMTLAEAFINCGFGSALIQKKQPTQEDYSTIFFWNMAVALLMYAVLFFCAPAISRFYGIPLLCSVLRVQALVLLIHALTLVQTNQLRKNLNFKILSVVTIVTSFISLGVTVVMAIMGFGVWALVVQNLISAAIPAAVYWFYVKWRPIMTFSKKSFSELFNFGFYLFLASLVNQFCKSIQTLLIGKIYSSNTLGYYSKAMGTVVLASNSISSVLTSVTYPLYVRIQDDMNAMRNMIKRIMQTSSLFTFPLMFVLILVGKALFVLLYSEKWLPSVPYFQILCLIGISDCLQSANSQTIAAIGKSKAMLIRTIVNRAVGLTVMVGGMLIYGIKGYLFGIVFFNYWCYLVNIVLVSKYIGYKWWQQLLDLLPITAVSVLAFVVSYFSVNPFHLSLYLDATLKLAVYLVVYLGWIIVFRPECYQYFLTVVPRKFRFWEK